MPESYNQDLLQHEIFEPVKAGTGKRFANYIIDLIIFYIGLFIIGIFWALISPDTLSGIDSPGFGLWNRLITLMLYGGFTGVLEGLGKGKTPGKFITRTRAVNEDGSAIDFRTAFIRGLCRAVPFNAFSALGSPPHPWHDKWTNTIVIDEKLSGTGLS